MNTIMNLKKNIMRFVTPLSLWERSSLRGERVAKFDPTSTSMSPSLSYGHLSQRERGVWRKRKESIVLITFLLLGLVFGVKAQEVIPLDRKNESSITAYLPAKEKATGTAVLVIPGGSYGGLATKTEGTPIAKAFAEKGIAAFVLKYRLPDKDSTENKSNGPLMDAQQAIKMIKEGAKQWGFDPNSVGVIGLSAGGHLAATLGTQFSKSLIDNPSQISLRPAFMILVYPVISMENPLAEGGSRYNLLGENPTPEKVSWFSAEQNVSWQTPPTYLSHTADDGIVKVENSIVMYQALIKEKIKAELHLFPEGNHGFIQRLPVNEWIDPMMVFIKKCGF
jgi:acetyl esterase/lipase